ncbi:hypothetical protein ZWY2020_011318 [Hordeum vulgare]|nr:hypothetical protein ZWY2020_011318 [Hordeum vulgare]
MGPAAGAVIEIISDDEKEDPFSAKLTADALEWASSLLLDDLAGLGEGLDDSAVIQELLSTLEGDKKGGAAADDDDDDDCVILDGDPEKPLVVVKEEKPGKDGAEEELQVVSEKGEVACRDFPHPRYLCARLPFGTVSHANHCTMCHCYVCDSRAPCPRWGKATPRAVQTVQAAPGSRGLPGSDIIQGFSTQRSLAAPVQVRPMPHLQAAPNGSFGTAGPQLRQCSARVVQETQRVTQATQGEQDASTSQKSWQVALANLASDLGVSDYNVDPPHIQQPVSTQPLHHSQLLAQPKAGQEGETPAAAHMRPSNGLPEQDSKSGDSVVPTQKAQALWVLNSESSLAASETSLNSCVDKPAMED